MFKVWLEELNKGYAYVFKRDRKMRPICYINVDKLKRVKTDHETLINMSTYMTQYVITRALIPGKIENWITIIDFKGVGVTEVPTKLIKAMTKPLQDYFKGRLFTLYIVNAKWAMKIVWQIAKQVVDPLTLLKFKLEGEKFHDKLHEAVDPRCLEAKFGGTIPDLQANFFPRDLRC